MSSSSCAQARLLGILLRPRRLTLRLVGYRHENGKGVSEIPTLLLLRQLKRAHLALLRVLHERRVSP